jgi:hypothetical protein
MNSSNTISFRALADIAPDRAEKFLTFLANLPDEIAAVKKYVRDFSALSPRRTVEDWAAFATKPEWEQRKESPYWPMPKELGQLRETLRRMWKEPDVRTRDWMAYNLRYYELIRMDFALVNPEVTGKQLPPPTPFERCLLHLGKCADRMRYCGNPFCVAPYFFARRRSQRYCSDSCAEPAQREYKRRWWDEYGDEWRRRRKKSKIKRKR